MKDAIYNTKEWREISRAAIARDQNRCTVARLLGGPCKGGLHGHHIVPVAEGGDPYDLDNVGTACAGHHPVWEAARRAIVRCRGRYADEPDVTRERAVRAARRFIRNIGHEIDSEAELVDDLYGWGGYLREYAGDVVLRDRMVALWRELAAVRADMADALIAEARPPRRQHEHRFVPA